MGIFGKSIAILAAGAFFASCNMNRSSSVDSSEANNGGGSDDGFINVNFSVEDVSGPGFALTAATYSFDITCVSGWVYDEIAADQTIQLPEDDYCTLSLGSAGFSVNGEAYNTTEIGTLITAAEGGSSSDTSIPQVSATTPPHYLQMTITNGIDPSSALSGTANAHDVSVTYGVRTDGADTTVDKFESHSFSVSGGEPIELTLNTDFSTDGMDIDIRQADGTGDEYEGEGIWDFSFDCTDTATKTAFETAGNDTCGSHDTSSDLMFSLDRAVEASIDDLTECLTEAYAATGTDQEPSSGLGRSADVAVLVDIDAKDNSDTLYQGSGDTIWRLIIAEKDTGTAGYDSASDGQKSCLVFDITLDTPN